jgi:hypothetical protein
MLITLSWAIMRRPGITALQQAVALVFAALAKEDGQWLEPTLETIAELSRLGRSTAVRVINELVAAGLVERQASRGRVSSRYRLSLDRWEQVERGTVSLRDGCEVEPSRCGTVEEVQPSQCGMVEEVQPSRVGMVEEVQPSRCEIPTVPLRDSNRPAAGLPPYGLTLKGSRVVVEDARVGAREATTTTTTRIDLGEEDRERLAPLVACGIDLGADLAGWVRITQGLDAGQVLAVLGLRRLGDGPVEWPSAFRALRERWEAQESTIAAAEGRRAAEGARRAQDAQERERQAVLRAEASRSAQLAGQARAAALSTPLGQRWAELRAHLVDGCPEAGPWLAGDCWPVALQAGVLEIHVANALALTRLGGELGRRLAPFAGEALGEPVAELHWTLNGFHHQAVPATEATHP